MCIDVCARICVGVCAEMGVGTVDMWADMCVDMCVDLCSPKDCSTEPSDYAATDQQCIRTEQPTRNSRHVDRQ